MEKETRNAIQTATQKARRLLETDFAGQLEGLYDIMFDGRVGVTGGAHLTGRQNLQRDRIIAAIEHKRAAGMKPNEAVADYLRDAAFTAINRFVALKMLEARGLVQECITRGDASSGFTEFCGLAPGVRFPDGSGYRLYLECIFDELSTEVKVLFDRRDPASVLWPTRATLDALLAILNVQELAGVWAEDETIGWVYQYFNSRADIDRARYDEKGKPKSPQNTRELAVRNQFFTPRYVVQFLTENTLGRIWFEMRGGETLIGQHCEYLVRRPDETWEPRAKKDPRDFKILDPACGSGHFLLYCFDLFVVIYEEAWADPDSPKCEITGHSLQEDYPQMADLRAAVPGLILRHNLHGVDIDPRCAQIGQLALWMRSQRAFRDFGITRAERPLIRRSNIVIAEPMPGEKELLAEFLRDLREDRLEGLLRRAFDIPPERTVKATRAMADSLAELVATVWEGMRLAAEMGALLKIERDLTRAIENGREEWEDRLPLFRVAEYGLGGVTKETLVRVVPGEHEDFWAKAEKLVFQALADYAAAATGAGDARRRLFAEDAAQGFALADLVKKRFDVVLVNPPFGTASINAGPEIGANYANSKVDLYAAFVERSLELLLESGRLGVISSRTGFFLTTYQSWRKNVVLRHGYLALVADLGFGVLDAKVETAAYCIQKKRTETDTEKTSLFIHLLTSIDKSQDLKLIIQRSSYRDEPKCSSVSVIEFEAIPTTPFAYQVNESLRKAFKAYPKFSSGDRTIKAGIQTSDDFRFVRLWWEVPTDEMMHIQTEIFDLDGHAFQETVRKLTAEQRWCQFAKGGEFSPFYADLPLVLNWGQDGREAKAFAETTPGTKHWSRRMPASEYYFRAGLSYLSRTTIRLCAFPLPAGALFSNEAGPAIFGPSDELLIYMGRFNSMTLEAFVSIFQSRGLEGDDQTKKYMVGLLQQLPWPPYASDEYGGYALIAHNAVQEIRGCDETSPRYTGPRWLRSQSTETAVEATLRNEDSILKAYQFQRCDVDGLSQFDSPSQIAEQIRIAQKEITIEHAAYSYLLGRAFGRWTNIENAAQKSWHPFRAERPLATFSHPTNSILVEDKGAEADIIARIFLETSGIRIWSEIGTPEDTLNEEFARQYFRKVFFDRHLRKH